MLTATCFSPPCGALIWTTAVASGVASAPGLPLPSNRRMFSKLLPGPHFLPAHIPSGAPPYPLNKDQPAVWFLRPSACWPQSTPASGYCLPHPNPETPGLSAHTADTLDLPVLAALASDVLLCLVWHLWSVSSLEVTSWRALLQPFACGHCAYTLHEH